MFNKLINMDVDDYVMSQFEYPGYYQPKIFGVKLKNLLRILYEEYHI